MRLARAYDGWMGDPFVPLGFEVPDSYAWSQFRLEPLGEKHNERDHDAWMASIGHIRSTPGFPDGNWPAEMSLADNLEDLVRHANDFESRAGFTYSILIGEDVIGCLYIYPSGDPGYDADVSSWVRESHSELDVPVWEALSTWIDEAWPFSNPYYAARV